MIGDGVRGKFQQILAGLMILGWMLSVTGAAAQVPAGVWSELTSKADARGAVRVIVRLKEEAPLPRGLATAQQRATRSQAIRALQQKFLDHLAKRGMALRHLKRFQYIPHVAFSADTATLQSLQDDPNVISIEEDNLNRPVLAESVPLIGVDRVFADGTTGAGWTVAITDTGVDKTHSFFGGRVVSEACYSTNDPLFSATSVCPGGVEQSTAVGSGVNCDANDPSLSGAGCDHGTHVAGIAAGNGAAFSGVAKDANIIAIQVFTKINNGFYCAPSSPPCVLVFDSDLILGAERVLALAGTFDIASVNMSVGGGRHTSNCDASEPGLKAVIDNLRAQDIATVIASGNNSYNDALSSPGCISTAVSVGSTTKSDSVSSFSNTASFLHLLAPGSSINSSVPGESFAVFSGTSMATPHVTGTWALMKQAAQAAGVPSGVDDILSALRNTGVPVTDPDNGLSFPRIQVDAAINDLLGPAPVVHNDFDGDRDADLLLYNTVDGTVASGFQDNGVLSSVSPLLGQDPATGWTVLATGDFNSDANSDLLYYNTITGEFGTVLLNGSTVLSYNPVLALDPASGFEIRGTGDFDDDGRGEIIVHDASTGLVALLFINADQTFNSIFPAMQVDVAGNWTLHGTGDFNGDRMTDLLLYNTVNGNIAIVQMNGAAVTSFAGVLALTPATGWTVETTADFNADGNFDLLLHNTLNGSVAAVLLNGTTILSETAMYSLDPAGDVELIGAGDFAKDGTADLLLYNTVTGAMQVALWNGVGITSVDTLITLAPATGWTLHSGKP